MVGPACKPTIENESRDPYDREKFTPVDLSRFFSCSPEEFAQHSLDGSSPGNLIRTPVGDQTLRGIPFRLAPEGPHDKGWLALSKKSSPSFVASVEIPLGQKANFLCLATFCDWDKDENPSPGADVIQQVGQHLGDAIFVYADGPEETIPMRRRFEVGSPSVDWGQLCFCALAWREESPRRLTESIPNAEGWGRLQMGVTQNSLRGPWISALENPHPERFLKAVRLRAAGEDPLVVCGMTLFHGQAYPLRYERLSIYRFTLPEPAPGDQDRWKVAVDLGAVARTYVLNEFDPTEWLDSPKAGLGEQSQPSREGRYLYAEVTASPAATLRLQDRASGRTYQFEVGQVVPGRELEAKSGSGRVEIIETQKVWLHGRVVDAVTRKPTPVRLAFRSRDGRYIPPYGHRSEINDAWLQDYGADLKLGDASFAYVDGTFQVELPVGDVYLEMTKGFEYGAVRKKLQIGPGQRELQLEIARTVDLRSQGWVSADVHVHFLSPTTGVLEGQAEGLNLINLLAAQWGDLFTNVGDLSHGPVTSQDGEMMVWPGTENRQHILGHLAALGTHGQPIFPMSASGPEESVLGDPLWSSLAEWAETCREREGLAVGAHFPYPTGEVAADVVMGKLDAVELYPGNAGFNTLGFLDWYRYLNCGYRLPAVAGTDKMGANQAVGANRCYANLGDREFSFQNWARAVRKGNTFTTTGPLLLFQADGHVPGDEIKFRAGGGTVEVQARATCFLPFHRLEIVLNGDVVAFREEPTGTREMILMEEVFVPGPGWLAARCSSRLTNWARDPDGPFPTQIVAHTSPVYVVVPGQQLFSPVAAAYFLTLIDGAQAWVETLATRPDAERFQKILHFFNSARDVLHRRLHEQGIKH